jgi:hypothetical protein
MHTVGARVRHAFTVVATATTAVLGVLAGPALASAAPAPSPSPGSSQNAAALCPQVPGRIWCFAERTPVSGPAVSSTPGGAMRADAATPASSTTPYGPADLRSAYALPDSTTTATVAIVDAYDAPDVESDLAAYRSTYGLPACTTANGCFRKVNQAGQTSPLPASNDGWTGETTLDVEMVSAICPTCHILLVEANDDDRSGQPNLEDALLTAVDLGAKYVSMSWGSEEFAGETSADNSYLSGAGVVYVAAAGDSGYETSWPAVSPNVVAVGGTTLTRAPGTTRGWKETAWSSGSTSGTGSGCSQLETQPSWQAQAPITAVCRRRAMNDVAAVADPATGVMVYQGGQWYRYGGTSAGTPMIAAMEAMAGSGAGAVAYPYTHASGFNDVTAGSNGNCASILCNAGSGWDGPTGVGTPDGLTGLGPVATDGTSGGTDGGSSGSLSASRPTTSAIRLHNPGTVRSYAGQRASVSVAATDSAHLSVTYRVTGLPSGVTLTSRGRLTGKAHSTGTYQVRVTAQDRAGNSAGERFTWHVKAHRIVPSRTPRATGRLRHGRTVTASWGTLRRDSRSGAVIHPAVRVQWYVNGRAVRGATHRSFTIPARDRGRHISFRLTATATFYSRYTHTSRRVRVS